MLDYRKGCWGYEYVQEVFILIHFHFLDYDVRKVYQLPITRKFYQWFLQI